MDKLNVTDKKIQQPLKKQKDSNKEAIGTLKQEITSLSAKNNGTCEKCRVA
jgi:hypothetical protein